ncbi:MAG: hypothetical protein JWO17_298 [Actinomycetia bacterium]|nr:hypothetical protein [Actinomycetes bacterium]
MSRPRAALAGAAAALVWGALEPIDKHIFRNDYSDIAVLGKLVTRTRAWPIAGIAFHAANGAVFGIAFNEARRRTTVPPRRLAVLLALGEHLALFPLSYLIDHTHPARGEPGVGALFNRRGFAQATARHALFGAVLGRLAA